MNKFMPLLSLVTLLGIFLNSCALKPVAWTPPTKPDFKGKLELNNDLQQIRKIDLQGWYGPEEFVMDKEGNLYCGVHIGAQDFSDGAILKITPKGKIEEYYRAGAWVTGLQFDKNNHLIALIQKKGLVSIDSKKKVTTLVSKDGAGKPILMGSGLKIASDGKIYFANISSKQATSTRYLKKLFLESHLTGGVYCYDPKTKKLTTLSDGNYFANGLALSQDESFLLLTETSRYRILKYWLKGPKAGKHEVFMDNLPGFPNNISLREDGSFWLGFTTKRNDALDKIHHKKGMKKFVYALPGFLQPKPKKFGMVLQISEEGNILKALFDPSGKQVSEAGAIKEYNSKLYIGGDVVPYISVYDTSK